MAHRTTPVTFEVVWSDRGHWCRTCLLGSGIRWVIALATNGGLFALGLQEIVRCNDCGGSDVEVEAGRGNHR